MLTYLKLNWNEGVAENFLFILERRLERLSIAPYSGSKVGLKDVRSILITKHNRLYYRVTDRKIIVLNIYDIRMNPANNPYKK